MKGKKTIVTIIMFALSLGLFALGENRVYAAEKTFKAAYYYGNKYDHIYGVAGDCILAEKKGKVGLVSLDGKELTGFIYNSFGIQPISADKKHILVEDASDNWFVLNTDGKVVAKLGNYNREVYFYRRTNIIECRHYADKYTYEYKDVNGKISAVDKYLQGWVYSGNWLEILDGGEYFLVYDADEEKRIKLLDSGYNVVTTFDAEFNRLICGRTGLLVLSGEKGEVLLNYDGTRVNSIEVEGLTEVEKNGNLIMAIYSEYGYDEEEGYEDVLNRTCKIMDLNGNVLNAIDSYDYFFYYGGSTYNGFMIQNDYSGEGYGVADKYLYDGNGKLVYNTSGNIGYSFSKNRKYIASRSSNNGLVIIDYTGKELAKIDCLVGSYYWIEDYLVYEDKDSFEWKIVDKNGKAVLTGEHFEDFVCEYPYEAEEIYFSGWLPLEEYGKWTIYKYTDENIKLVDATKVESTNNSSSSNVTKPAKISLKSATNKKGKKVKLTWKKVSGVAGYQIQYATNKKFTKKLKKTTAKKSATSKTIKKLKKKKTYYFRVRAYKTANGKKVYGKWSKVKKVKIKK